MEPGTSDNSTSMPLMPNLNVSSEAVETFLASHKSENPRKIICICGHAISKHSDPSSSRKYCASGKMLCRCSEPKPVLKVEDARFFIRWTHGWGPKHALALGLNSYLKTGKSVEWLIQPVCFVCKDPSRSVSPASVNRGLRVSNRCDELNGLFCDEHIRSIHGITTRTEE